MFSFDKMEINVRLSGKKSGKLFLSLQGVGERIEYTLQRKVKF